MECPRCESNLVPVTNTYPYDKELRRQRRRHKCSNCRKVFYTWESCSPNVAGNSDVNVPTPL